MNEQDGRATISYHEKTVGFQPSEAVWDFPSWVIDSVVALLPGSYTHTHNVGHYECLTVSLQEVPSRT